MITITTANLLEQRITEKAEAIDQPKTFRQMSETTTLDLEQDADIFSSVIFTLV